MVPPSFLIWGLQFGLRRAQLYSGTTSYGVGKVTIEQDMLPALCLWAASGSPISGSMNEDRNSWGRVDRQKLTDIIFCPSPSWPHSPCCLQVQCDRLLSMFQSHQAGLWRHKCFVWSREWTREGPGRPGPQPLWPACAISGRSGRVGAESGGLHLARCFCTSDALGVRCFSEPKFWFLVYMLVFMEFLLMWL